MPSEISGLVNHVKAYELLTAEAGISGGDYEKALMALSTSPLIPSVKIARKILDDILRENKEYLTQFSR